ncbi:hypothetical protein F4810DRAFT_696480 [Camillea tinctor]|nr:hypothetical protein F4810DRAFT_696480 [Camillea tinctor]
MWIYSMFAAGVSLIVCLCHLFFTVTSFGWNLLDWVVFIFWVAEFGVFGSIYIGSTPTPPEASYSDRSRMVAAVWIDMINMILWFASALVGVLLCCARRHTRKQLQAEEGLKMMSVNRGHTASSQ